MPFSPASRLSDHQHVWVERSIFEGVDQAVEKHFGPANGQTAQTIAARFAYQFSENGRVISLTNPLGGTRAQG